MRFRSFIALGSCELTLLPLFVALLVLVLSKSVANSESVSQPKDHNCGSKLTEPRGIIQTPNFPEPFSVPIKCQWVIDVSSELENTSIVIYLTQLFVTTGLKFTEYPYYDESFPSIGGQLIHSVTEKNVTTVQWILTRATFVVIDFQLDRLEGNHLRAMDGLLDVYGFNITYEARHDTDDPVRNSSCSVVACSLDGHCYANENFTEYWCSCFPDFQGDDCGQGPLCRHNRNICENNATCRHAGATAVYCSCPPSFTGPRCEIPIPPPSNMPECDDSGCALQCAYKEEQKPCSCTNNLSRAPTDRARYEGTVRLAPMADGTSVKEFLKIQPNRTLHSQLEKQLTRFLKNNHVTKLEEMRVINISSEGDVTFHFFGGKSDGRKVRDALNKLMENGRLGNINLVSTQLAFRQEPTLLLQEVIINHKKPVVRHGDEFTLSCIAQGSSYMTFRWLKDGVIINETKALRNIWTKLLPLDTRDRYTALLGIKHADILDEGRYTCQVTDWGFEQCKSINLEVIPPPLVKVTPMSVTLEKGDNLTIRCMWQNERADEKQVYGYSWFKESKDSKDAHLFKMERDKEVWEDLHPAGSILKIYNIQKSTRYTCQVQSNVNPVNASIDVVVWNKSAVPWCLTDETGVGGIQWVETGAWNLAKVECPAQYTGIATRLCTLVNRGQAQWQSPDYSDCVSDRLSDLGKSFRSLTLGFENTSGTDTILGVLGLLRDRTVLYPGEGEPALALLQNISWYLNFTSAWDDLVHATPFFFSTINALLQHQNAIVNSQKVVDLQKLINKWALLWGDHIIGTSVNGGHLSFESLVVDVFSFDSTSVQGHTLTLDVPRPTYSYPAWFKASVSVLIELDGFAALKNNITYSIAVIIYKDLTQYLPPRHVYRKDDGNEVQYEVASNIVSVVANTPLQVIVDVNLPTSTKSGWNTSCGAMSTPWTEWKLDQCFVTITKKGSNMTRCSCKLLGSFTTLITKYTSLQEMKVSSRGDGIVLLGCVCCLVQCLLTLALLFVRWYHNPTCLVFLKVQCCVAIAATMVVFLSATRANIPQSAYPYLMTSLEAFLLIGMSSHLSKLLLVYTEVVHLPKIHNIKQTVICIVTGFPLLVVLCNHLAHNATGWNLKSWWLVSGTMLFYTCIICGLLLTLLFVFVYCSVIRRLALLSKIKTTHSDTSKAIERRVGLLKRAAIIFVTTLIMSMASIFYINFPGHASQYAFSFTCALLGFVLLVCYVVYSESSLHLHILQKLNMDVGSVYSSGSDSNPLSFFTKQDGEIESESAPPLRKELIKESSLSGTEESLAMKDVDLQPIITEPPIISDHMVIQQSHQNIKGGKMVTFHSDLVTGCDQGTSEVDLESYPSSPRKLKSTPDSQFSDDIPNSEKWQFIRTSCYQNPTDCVQSNGNQLAQEILTTRVCVELGVIKNSTNKGELVETPTIVLCSVDVEPCPGKVVELNEVTVKTVSENGNPSITEHEYINKKESAMNTVLDESGDKTSDSLCSLVHQSNDSGDVLQKISHDLDYLLNRTPQDSNGNSSSSLNYQRKPSVSNIKEEDELGNMITTSGLIAKTSL